MRPCSLGALLTAAALASAGCTAIFGDARNSDGGAGDLAGIDLRGADFASSGGGQLTGAGQNANGVVNLTTEGSADWAHWGLTNATDFDHKMSGGTQIADFSTVGGATPKQFAAGTLLFTWTDGTPHANATASPTGVYAGGVGAGFSVTAPAGKSSHTLRVYVGGFRSTGRLVAHLSDGSAPDYNDAQFSSGNGNYAAVYTLTYSAASDGKQLDVTWTEDKNLGSGINPGTVSLASATLK